LHFTMMEKKTKYICSNCGTVGQPVVFTRGSFWIELVLWWFFIIPGFIYTWWRLSGRKKVCPVCKKETMIPLNTPLGEKTASEMGKVLNENKEEYIRVAGSFEYTGLAGIKGTNWINYRGRQGKNWFRIFARIIVGIVGGLFFLVIAMLLTSGDPVGLEDTMFIVVYAIVLVPVIIAWQREKIVGILLIVYAIAFFLYGYFTGQYGFPLPLSRETLKSFLITGPILLAGILFLLSDWKSKREAANL